MLRFSRSAIAAATTVLLAGAAVLGSTASATAATTSATVRTASAATVFAGGPYLQATSQPAKYAEQLRTSDPAGSAAAATIARYPIAIWLGEWLTDTSLVSTLRTAQAAAAKAGTTPVYVTYAIPNRDCGGYSAGGMTADRYEQWVDLIASTLRGQRAVVIVEPDSLAALSKCPDEAATRYALLDHEVTAFTAAGVASYLDAGNSNWVQPAEMASRLLNAGVAKARGFFSNVSNYYPTDREQAYDETISALTGGSHYVIDTSRNGQGWRGDWCNGVGAGLGTTPRVVADGTRLDALLWVKTPGASDGSCNGAPEAGDWYSAYAQALVANAVLGAPAVAPPSAPTASPAASAAPSASASAAPSASPAAAPSPSASPSADPSPDPVITRIAGVNAYETAASAALSAFPSPSTVFIASRSTFPDALGAGAAAGHEDAPVLLTAPDSLPAATASALRTMSPSRIVVVGGTSAITTAVQTALQQFAPVTRLAGSNRFATSAAISAATFTPGVDVAYVATGTNFPDALSGAAVAASTAANGPMLLVSGATLPAPIAAELARLRPATIIVLGGTGVVSDSLKDTMATYTATGTAASVTRWSGNDRFATSAAIARNAHPSGVDSGTAYVATGMTFPDALAAAPVAGRTGSPLLLVRQDSVPDAVASELDRIAPTRIVVLGGTAAVASSVVGQL